MTQYNPIMWVAGPLWLCLGELARFAIWPQFHKIKEMKEYNEK